MAALMIAISGTACGSRNGTLTQMTTEEMHVAGTPDLFVVLNVSTSPEQAMNLANRIERQGMTDCVEAVPPEQGLKELRRVLRGELTIPQKHEGELPWVIKVVVDDTEDRELRASISRRLQKSVERWSQVDDSVVSSDVHLPSEIRKSECIKR